MLIGLDYCRQRVGAWHCVVTSANHGNWLVTVPDDDLDDIALSREARSPVTTPSL